MEQERDFQTESKSEILQTEKGQMHFEEMQRAARSYHDKWFNYLKELRQRLGKDGLKLVYSEASSPYCRLSNFIYQIDKKYGNDKQSPWFSGKCLIRHAIGGSTVNFEDFSREEYFLDYEGEDSIINYLEKLIIETTNWHA